jgi:hypothetical protein
MIVGINITLIILTFPKQKWMIMRFFAVGVEKAQALWYFVKNVPKDSAVVVSRIISVLLS